MNQHSNSMSGDVPEINDCYSSEEFRLLVDAVTEYAIFRLDPAGRIASWNKGAEKIKGYAKEDILGQHFSIFYTEGDKEKDVPAQALAHAADEGMWTSEGWRLRSDGTRFWAHVTITALYDEGGTLSGFAKVTRDMTERHEYEERLAQEKRRAEEARNAIRQSEERYRRLFEDAQEGIVISSVEGEIIDINPAFQDILGYSREELLTMNATELYVDPQQREEAAALLAQQGAVRNLELRARHKSGRELTVELSTTVRRNRQGEVIAYQSLLRDITERKKMQDALKESEAKFRALTERALVGIGMLQEGVYKYVNPVFARLTGYTQEELIGQSPEMLFHPSDIAHVQEQVRRREAGEKEEAHYETRIVTKEDETRLVEIRGTRIDYQGKPAIIGMISDITERRRARDELKESEAKFRALAENAPVGILLIQDGRLEYANEALAEMYGYAPEELLGQVYADTLVHSTDRSSVRNNIDARLKGERKSMHFQFRGLKKSGETIQVDAYGTRTEYQGRPAIVGMDIDVTDRLRLQREVLSMQEEERRRMGRELHDGVSSQLTNLALMLSLLSRRIGKGQVTLDEISDQLEEIQDRVIESGEDVRRLSRGLAPAGLSSKELPDALARLVENVEGGRFENTAEDLTAQGETTTAHLYRIAQEAVTNAQKHAKATSITIRLGRENGAIVLESKDDGQGFDVAAVTKESLGLRTMRYRADLMGGTLIIRSVPGQGTYVCCRVPVST